MLALLITRLLWKLYAPVYDSLRHIAPYRQMLDRIAEAVAMSTDERTIRVLDVGTGTGNAADAIRASNRLPDHTEYVGVDGSSEMLARANKKADWLTTRCTSLDGRLPYDDNHFDVVVSSNVLYMLADPKHALGEMFRVLRPGGQLIITTPRHNPSLGAIVRSAGWAQVLRHLPALLVVGVLNLIIINNHSYIFFEEAELAHLLELTKLETTYAGQVWFAATRKEA